MTTEPTPTADGVLGTPPEPRRPVAVRVPSPREAHPAYRSMVVNLAAIVGSVAVVVIVGVLPDAAPAAPPALLALAGVATAGNARAVGEHLARGMAGKAPP